MDPLRALLVEDSPTDAKLVLRELRRGGREVICERVEDEASMRAALTNHTWDVVLSDWAMPCFAALRALCCLAETGLDLPFIIVSGTVGEDLAVEAMRAGAHDFIPKHNLTRLMPALQREIKEYQGRRAFRAAREALAEAEVDRSRLAAIVRSSSEAIYSADTEGVIQNWNAGAETLYGFCSAEIVGKNGSLLVPPTGLAEYEEFLTTLRSGHSIQIEAIGMHKSGHTLEVSLGLSPIRDGTGKIVGTSIVGRDIQLQKLAQRALQTSLREKDVLLKEIHHRVKNNLQVISSLLNLQAREVKDPGALEMFRASQTRVRSIALFHEKFYQSKDLGKVDIGGYLGDLVRGLLAAHAIEPNQVRVVVDAEPMSLGVDTAIPCGLIVNELATNSLKHAFPDGRKGQLKITLRRDGPVVSLRIEDDGIGLPAHVAEDAESTLGMTLVRTLAEQLGARLNISVQAGTSIDLEFTVTEQDQLKAAA